MGAPLPGHRYDLICFSHLRWEAAVGRPQRVLARAARDHRVFFVETPVFERAPAHLSLRRSVEGVMIVQPTLPKGTPVGEVTAQLRELVDHLVDHLEIAHYVLWFSTPAALPFAHHLAPAGVVYDCLDEAAGPRGSADQPTQLELRLLGAADVVFTGGAGHCEAMRDHHANVHELASDRFAEAAWEPTWTAMERALDEAIATRAAAVDELEALRRARNSAPGIALSL